MRLTEARAVVLMELFGQPERWAWIRNTPKSRRAGFQVGDVRYRADFEHEYMGGGITGWEVSFRVIGDPDKLSWDDFGVTGTGNAAVVFATVLDILKRFLIEEQPDTVIFSAQEKSRRSLYTKMVARFAKPLGYEVEDYDMREGIFLLRRIGLPAVGAAA